jgi:hypothetical protein
MKLATIYNQIIFERLTLSSKERVHVSNKLIDKIGDIKQTNNTYTGKPLGFWYSFGDPWIEFLKNDMPSEYWENAKYLYKVFPKMDKILVINTEEELYKFTRDYRINNGNNGDNYIDWIKVSENYSGFEMPKYDDNGFRNLHTKGRQYMWVYSIDIPSGCIWNADGVQKLKLFKTEKTNKEGEKKEDRWKD